MREWTEEEDQYLRKEYARLSSVEMSLALGRTPEAIRFHLALIGIVAVGIEVVCRFCGEHFTGRKKDAQRGCCKKSECREKNRLEKNLDRGRQNHWSAQREWTKKNQAKVNERNRADNLTSEQHKRRQELWRNAYWRDPERVKTRVKRITSDPKYKRAARQRHRAKYHLIGYGQVRQYAKANNIDTDDARNLLYEHFKDKMICNICGRTADQIPDLGSRGRRGFHVDHIDGNRANYALANLQVLCWKCNTCKLDMPICDRSKILIKELTDIYYEIKRQFR